MAFDKQQNGQATAVTRRNFLTSAAAVGTSGLLLQTGMTAEPSAAAAIRSSDEKGRARISVRVGVGQWKNESRRKELLAFIQEYRDAIDEVALFTSFTHPPLPLAEIESRAALLAEILPRIKAIGVAAGINHLATMGHLDENLDNSLREPWQHLVDFDGSISVSCYCTADPQMQAYVRACYITLAKAGPDFLWVDDDVRLESHGPIRFSCFCDRCMAQFSQESGKAWTRDALVAALRSGPRQDRIGLRTQWLAHNRLYIEHLLTTIRDAVDTVDKTIPLGLMTAETSYSGYGFAQWAKALAGRGVLPVKWRPGGGFYTDDMPAQLLDKAHSMGRQVGFLPATVAEVQYEHENFPYQRLKKSAATFTAEIAAAIGAGCTGAALNCLGIADDPLGEFRDYFDGVRASRPFYDAAVAAVGRSPCEGVWTAFTADHFAALQADGDWFSAPTWGGDLRFFNEMAEIGIPPAYSRSGALVVALSGDSCLDFSKEELRTFLSGGVLLDVPALARLHEMGLGEYAGFSPRGRKDKDSLEQFTSDSLNGRFDGWHRDCRPSFWPEPVWLIEPTSADARPLSQIVDFAPKSFGPASGIFENRLGGRVAVFGYYPWRSLQSLAKTSQLKSVCRWLSRDKLPACVDSYAKAALWCRRDAQGRKAVVLQNGSADPLTNLVVRLRGIEQIEAVDASGGLTTLQRTAADGHYSLFIVPGLAAWQPLLMRAIQ